MRIFVFEFVTGGGLAGRAVPRSLAREGLAMRTALVADLAAIKSHKIVMTTDTRFVRPVPHNVDLVPIVGRALPGPPGEPDRARPTSETGATATIDALVNASDAVWLIAPETNRCLERLAARIERQGKALLGPSASAVRRAADKSRLPGLLARAGIEHPETAVISDGSNARAAATRIGYPVVVKPARGAGCGGVRLARGPRELGVAMEEAHRANGTGPLVMQRFVPGRAASVSLIADGHRAVPMAVSAQRVTAAPGLSYHGGSTPFDHPQAEAAATAASRTCAAIPGLRGYVGVDLVLTSSAAVVIEVNPRLTMSYLGLRAVLEENVAALALEACHGRLPRRPVARRHARFTAAGRVASS